MKRHFRFRWMLKWMGVMACLLIVLDAAILRWTCSTLSGYLRFGIADGMSWVSWSVPGPGNTNWMRLGSIDPRAIGVESMGWPNRGSIVMYASGESIYWVTLPLWIPFII